MRIVVVGPGAIGCLFGAALTRAGNDVVFVHHDAARAADLCARGLRVIEPDGEWTVPAVVHARATRLGKADLVLICVKAYATDDAIRAVMPMVSRRTTVVSLQNGLSNGVVLAAHVGPERVVCAVTGQGATLEDPGVIRHAGFGPTSAGPFNPAQEDRAATLARLLTEAGFDAQHTANTAGIVWGKLIVNCALNPVTALWNVPNGQLLEQSDIGNVAERAAREAEKVARAKGVSLPYADAVEELKEVCRRSRANISSMLQDVRRGRRTEISEITGAAVREGRAIDIDMPTNEDLLRRVLTIERDP